MPNPTKQGHVARDRGRARGGIVQRPVPQAVVDPRPSGTTNRRPGYSGRVAPSPTGENLTDLNGNGIFTRYEPFDDGTDIGKRPPERTTTDGQYDRRPTIPSLTGYVGRSGNILGDSGSPLKAEATRNTPAPGQYYSIDLPRTPDERGADDYRWNIANCNPTLVGPGRWSRPRPDNMAGPTAQGMRDLIDKDPGAYWDDASSA